MKRVVTGFGVLLVALVPCAPHAAAQASATVVGVVRDTHGIPQMGALIELLGPGSAVVAQTYTDDHGRYLLGSVSPGRYELRASASLLVPSLRPNLLLNPGVRALANLTMTAMLEIGTWFPAQRRTSEEASDDWRWTLRSTANRPLLRLDDDDPLLVSTSAEHGGPAPVVHERLSVLSGDGSFADGGTHQVLSLQHSEKAGQTEMLQADLGQPLMNGDASSFDIHAGMQRKSLLGGVTQVVTGFSSHPEIAGPGGIGLQAFTLASGEKVAIGDAVVIDAGTLLTAERLVQSRLSASPFLRVVVAPAAGFALMYRYAGDRTLQESDDLSHLRPQAELLSDADGRPVNSRNAHQELALARRSGKDTETIAIYQDMIRTGSVAGLGVVSAKNAATIPQVSDLGSNTFRLSLSGYTARGASMSWTHEVGPALMTTVAVELGSALQRSPAPLVQANLDSELKHMAKPALRAEARGRVERTGTNYRVQYRWQPETTLDSVDPFNNALDQAYLSCSLRQKLWIGRRLQGVDAVLEATNLLEDGYQPMVGPDGQTLILAQVPRTIQAGLSFSF